MQMTVLRVGQFQYACTAVRRVGGIDNVFLAVELIAIKGATCPTGEAVVTWIVAKRPSVELRAIALTVEAHVGSNMRQNALGFKCRRQRAIGLSSIGQNIQPLPTQGLPRRLRD